MKQPRKRVWLALSAGLSLGAVGIGCDNSAPPAANNTPPTATGGGNSAAAPTDQSAKFTITIDDSDPHAAGMKVFSAKGCANCHRIGGKLLGGSAMGISMGGGRGGPPGGGPPPGGPPGGPGGPTASGPPSGGPAPGGPGGPPPGGPGGPPPGSSPGGPGGPGGPGRGGPGRAPDLAKVGADPAHTIEWLSNFIKDPKSIKSDSRMPGYADRITDDELKALAEYLASLKE